MRHGIQGECANRTCRTYRSDEAADHIAIERGPFGRVVVYSIDRLTRRLYDLAKLLELLDRGSVA